MVGSIDCSPSDVFVGRKKVRRKGLSWCVRIIYFFFSTGHLHSETVPTEQILRGISESTINSLKHKILVFLFRNAKRLDDAGDHIPLRKFFQYFDEYRLLRMWKMQLLDENHLLIKYSSEDVVTLKVAEPNSQASFFVIYNINENQILSVFNNTSEELLYLFENFCDMFRNCDSPFICSPSNNIYANLMHQRFKQTIIGAKGGGVVEATKRLLAQLPISAQSYSSSPYLDLSLFSYDDKWVSCLERPKACAEYPIR
jgi:de-etiolated-1